MTDLIVHHLDHSRSQRLLWLLEELGLDYELRVYQRNRGSRAPDTLKQIHPLGKSPVLQHGDVVLAESGAIVEHVLDELAEGRLRPEPGTAAHRDYRFWLHFAEGSMMSPLLVKLLFDRLRKAVPVLGRVIANKVDEAFTLGEIHAHLAHVERTLEDREWLAGELSGADVMMSYPVLAALSRGGDTDRYPRVKAYVARIEARPAWQRALAKGGPVLPA